MVGDLANMVDRLRSVLPARWFGETTPVLDTLLSGLAAAWVYVFELLQFVRTQARLATASGPWLDLTAQDYFGSRIARRIGQADGPFRSVLQRHLFCELGTRRALVSALVDLTGRTPIIFEPANTSDTGSYGCLEIASSAIGGGAGYGVAGGWGNLGLPYQCFVTAFRPISNGVSNIAGWGGVEGAYGVGSLEYADLDLIQGHVSDADILDEAAGTAPVGVILWTRIIS